MTKIELRFSRKVHWEIFGFIQKGNEPPRYVRRFIIEVDLKYSITVRMESPIKQLAVKQETLSIAVSAVLPLPCVWVHRHEWQSHSIARHIP